jgi:putative transposase
LGARRLGTRGESWQAAPGRDAGFLNLRTRANPADVHAPTDAPPNPGNEENAMPGRKHTQEEMIAKLRQVEALTAQGRTLSEAIESIEVADATYHRWRKELGSLKVDQMQRLRELESENLRLRQAVLDLTLDKMALQEMLRTRQVRGVRDSLFVDS